jgi:hypothetical protein
MELAGRTVDFSRDVAGAGVEAMEADLAYTISGALWSCAAIRHESQMSVSVLWDHDSGRWISRAICGRGAWRPWRPTW